MLSLNLSLIFYHDWIADALLNHPETMKKEIRNVNYAMLVKFFIMHPILVSRYLLTKIGIHINR